MKRKAFHASTAKTARLVASPSAMPATRVGQRSATRVSRWRVEDAAHPRDGLGGRDAFRLVPGSPSRERATLYAFEPSSSSGSVTADFQSPARPAGMEDLIDALASANEVSSIKRSSA